MPQNPWEVVSHEAAPAQTTTDGGGDPWAVVGHEAQPQSAISRFAQHAGIPTSRADVRAILHPPQGESALSTMPVFGPAFEAQRQTFEQPGIAAKVYGSIPLLGPIGYRMGQDLSRGDWPSAAGDVVNMGLFALTGREGGPSRIASHTRAMESLAKVREAAGDVAVDHGSLLKTVDQSVNYLEKNGHTVPKPLTTLQTRLTKTTAEKIPGTVADFRDVPPGMNFDQLHDFRRNLDSQIYNDAAEARAKKLSADPPSVVEMKKVRGAISDALNQTADAHDVGSEWQTFNKLFATAAKTEDFSKWAGRATGAGAGYFAPFAAGAPHPWAIGLATGPVGGYIGGRLGGALARSVTGAPAIVGKVVDVGENIARGGTAEAIAGAPSAFGRTPQEQLATKIANGLVEAANGRQLRSGVLSQFVNSDATSGEVMDMLKDGHFLYALSRSLSRLPEADRNSVMADIVSYGPKEARDYFGLQSKSLTPEAAKAARLAAARSARQQQQADAAAQRQQAVSQQIQNWADVMRQATMRPIGR